MYGAQRADGRSPGGVASSQQKQINWGVSLLSKKKSEPEDAHGGFVLSTRTEVE